MSTARAGTALAWTLIALLGGGAAANAGDLGSKIQQKQAEVHETHEKLQSKRQQLDQARIKVQSLQSQLSSTEHEISLANAHVDELEAQARGNQRKLAWNQRQLDAARSSLELHTDALRKRVVAAYEQGAVSYLNVLLASTSFSDFVERWEDIRMLIDANQKTVRERREAEAKVASVQRELQTAQAQLDATVARERQAKLALDALEGQRRALVAAADDRRQEVATEVTQLEGLSASEESSLESLIVERQREAEAQREAARRAAQLAGGDVPPPAGGGGQFGWPASGPITSPFGYRADPYGSKGSDFHPGIDIGAPYGSTITAAADGTVIFAGWYGGYGNAVIVDHGGGVSTLYGHCSQLFVSEHQTVQRGQALGAVGSTGHSTGPHLHFEVRVNGSPVDPLSRLH
jgi:murein DD-endopeptidase MepM/ murein hydrolase activator NlpD